ncbi:growth-regulated alpha protein-like isoform X2 [Mauremys mutica]|uniref:growth-regulated alpha protein-like isoform X2 n=1 Tax=Mauremys mutica TaxID=74926 RepID=UPI001D16A023|nr:growth-regulated alpha protein-like isoform X2 [Mauremys mutica]
MSRPESFAPGSPLLLLLLAACAALCRDAPMAGELRCQCLQTEAALIPPKRVAHVELIPEGHHCGVPEVIATTKNGKKVCLDPTAPWVQLIVTKILNSPPGLHLWTNLPRQTPSFLWTENKDLTYTLQEENFEG